MPFALLVYLSAFRKEAFDGARVYSAAEVFQLALDWCAKHGEEYPGDDAVKNGWNSIKQSALRRTLGIT